METKPPVETLSPTKRIVEPVPAETRPIEVTHAAVTQAMPIVTQAMPISEEEMWLDIPLAAIMLGLDSLAMQPKR